nr:helix-turn-helix domain-containing protein [Mycobacterium simiae]
MRDGQSSRRSYSQYCAIARALDLVGERWTLLLVRELLLGPMRYADLLDDLPGIGTNLLARRLQDLEEAGIVERQVLPRPARSTVYALTRQGQLLEPAIVALGRFGGRWLPEHPGSEQFRPRWAVTGLKHTFRPDQAPKKARSYQLELDDETFHVCVKHGTLIASQGPAPDPDVIIDTTALALLDLLGGHRTVRQALRGTVQVRIPDKVASTAPRDAKIQALEEFVSMFGWGRSRSRHRDSVVAGSA